jgi:hypothetical protein
MAHLGWTTPKTAIGYVQKSRQTSLNVSMFLSNVQRENKDLDTIMDLLKKKLDPSSGHQSTSQVVPNPKVNSKVFKAKKQKKSDHSVFDESLASQFSSHLLEAGERDNKVRNLVQSENSRIVQAINAESTANESVSHVGVGGSLNEVGSGRGSVVAVQSAIEVGSGAGVGSAASLELDSRVASILNNIQHRGELHVHFHFGGK